MLYRLVAMEKNEMLTGCHAVNNHGDRMLYKLVYMETNLMQTGCHWCKNQCRMIEKALLAVAMETNSLADWLL